VPGVRVRDVVQRHRRALVEELQRYTRLKADTDPTRDLNWLLVLDALVLRVEAAVHWLDQCEGRLGRTRQAAGETARARPARRRAEVRR
jgi:hypothetical protein